MITLSHLERFPKAQPPAVRGAYAGIVRRIRLVVYSHGTTLPISEAGRAKYQRHSDFIRVVRGIPAYREYVGNTDIVELSSWKQAKAGCSESEQLNENSALYKALRAVTFRALYLLNKTAQAALANFLEDLVSRQSAVVMNTMIARQMTGESPPADMLPVERAKREMAAHLDVCKMLGVPDHIGQQEAVNMVLQSTGVNSFPLLEAAAAQNNIAKDEV